MLALSSCRARPFFQFRPSLEALESRHLMAGLDVPQLSSRAGAAASIYLDFDGHFEAAWGAYANVTSPAYDRDGNVASFSAAELSAIQEIWTRVAEDFAPFNINVTTVLPVSLDDTKNLTIVVGGSSSDWYGTQVNGVSFTGSFTSSDPNVGYVFSNDLGTGFPRWVADQISHEAGHCFGLMHQSSWSGNLLTAELSGGSNGTVPIMGSNLFASRSIWFNGPTKVSPTSLQDDMAIIASATNGFGFVTDDFSDTLATATQLPTTGSSVSFSGLIGQTGDQDVFEFTTAGGNLSFSLAVARFGANLDSVLELRDANGQLVTIANDTTSGVFTSALSANVAVGTYYLIVRSSGGYGNVGQYTMTGTLVPGNVTAPEISVLLNGTDLVSGANVNFGSTFLGTPITQTFTLQNLGNGDLTVSPLAGAVFPAGFSLATDLSSTLLAPGQSTTFSVQFDATLVGAFSGTLHLLSNDADEGSFDIVVGGTVTQPIITAPEIRVWGHGTEMTSGDSLSFGTPLLGTSATKIFTIQNVGDGDLVLSPIDPSALPNGYSLVQGLGATTLHPTDLTTFVVQFNATALGTFGGTLHILSNDVDKGSFDVNLTGTATAPEIRIFAGTTELASGAGFSLGSTLVGSPVSQTFTIQNAGDGDLEVSGFDSNSLPAGYSLVASFGNTTVPSGGAIIFTVQLDATTAGTFGGTIHILSSDSDENSFDIALSGVVKAPEIAVFVNGTELTSGGAIDFGPTLVGSSVTRVVTVTNIGDTTLDLSPIDPSTLPAGFSLVSNLGATTLAPGQSTTFTLGLDAATSGSFSGIIHLSNNDADEGSFAIVLQGAVNNPPPTAPYVKTVDNGDDGFTTTGTWHVQNGKGGFEQDIQFANKAQKKDQTFATATWSFTGLAAGQYRVSVTAPRSPSYASDAPFSVFDGATLLRTVLVNQSKGAGKPAPIENQWQKLGTFTIQGSTLLVRLSNRANGHVVADAVRIERLETPADPTPPSFNPPDNKDDQHHDKDAGATSNNGGPHKPSFPHKNSPPHKPAAPTPQQHKSHGHTKPAASDNDPSWLNTLATDVALQRGTKSRK